MHLSHIKFIWSLILGAKEKRTSSNQLDATQPSGEYDTTSMNPNLPISDDEGDHAVTTIRSTTSTSSSSVSEV